MKYFLITKHLVKNYLVCEIYKKIFYIYVVKKFYFI